VHRGLRASRSTSGAGCTSADGSRQGVGEASIEVALLCGEMRWLLCKALTAYARCHSCPVRPPPGLLD
jgi:hypothetical protein